MDDFEAPKKQGFRFDPSLSWGDLAVALSLALSGILAFAQLSNRVSVAEVKIVQTEAQAVKVGNDLNAHKTESVSSDLQIRAEFRDQVREINSKLDRLIERELNGSGR